MYKLLNYKSIEIDFHKMHFCPFDSHSGQNLNILHTFYGLINFSFKRNICIGT